MKFKFLREAPGDEPTAQQGQQQGFPEPKKQVSQDQDQTQNNPEKSQVGAKLDQDKEEPKSKSEKDRAVKQDAKGLAAEILKKPKEEQDFYAFVVAMCVNKLYDKSAKEVIKTHNDLYPKTANFYENNKIKALFDAVIPLYYAAMLVDKNNKEGTIKGALTSKMVSRYSALYYMTRFNNSLKVDANVDKIVYVLDCYSSGKLKKALQDDEYRHQIYDVVVNYTDNDVADFCYIFSAYSLAFNVDGMNPNEVYLVDDHWKTELEVEDIYLKQRETKRKQSAEEVEKSAKLEEIEWENVEDNIRAIVEVYNMLSGDDMSLNTDRASMCAKWLAKELFDVDVTKVNNDIKLKLPVGYENMKTKTLAKLLPRSKSWRAYFGIEK